MRTPPGEADQAGGGGASVRTATGEENSPVWVPSLLLFFLPAPSPPILFGHDRDLENQGGVVVDLDHGLAGGLAD
jgi:hypothetical protein